MWIPIEMAAVDPADEEEFRLWEPKPLSLKVVAFGKYAKEQSLELDGTVVKKYFLPKQVSGLWQMLKGKVKKSAKPAQAWIWSGGYRNSRSSVSSVRRPVGSSMVKPVKAPWYWWWGCW